MMPVATTGGGETFAAPDVCITPPSLLPIPYPNTAELATAMATAPTVFVQCMPVVVVTSVLPMSMGDEPGVLGGVASGVNMSSVEFLLGSSKVFAAGEPVVYLAASTGQNGASFNVPGAVISVGQGVVFTAP